MIENVHFFLSISLNNSQEIYMHEFYTEILFYFLWIVKLCPIVYL